MPHACSPITPAHGGSLLCQLSHVMTELLHIPQACAPVCSRAVSQASWVCRAKDDMIVNGPISVNPNSISASDPVTAASEGKGAKQPTAKGLWTRCDKCGVILYIKHLKASRSASRR